MNTELYCYFNLQRQYVRQTVIVVI